MAGLTKGAMNFVSNIFLHVFCVLAFAFAPRYVESCDSHEKFNLLAPPQFVFCAWVFLATSAIASSKVIKRGEESLAHDVFVYILEDLRPCFGVLILLLVSLVATLAIMTLSFIFWSGHWPYLTLAALIPMWCMAAPYYVKLESRCQWRIQNAIDAIQFTMDKMALRLWFVWLTAALIFSLLDALQVAIGECFNFAVYAYVMGLLVAVSIAAYIQTRDPVVAWVAAWFIVGLVMRKTKLEGDAKETLDKLQTAATVVAPLFVLVLFLHTIQGFYDFLADLVPRSEVSSNADGRRNAVYRAV